MSLGLGTRIGSYTILGHLGAGGMGVVYRALDTRLEREVALKILPTDLASDPERLTRFEREARLLASLNHPNVCAIHGIQEGEGIRALVLELVEGRTLEELIGGTRETTADAHGADLGRDDPLAHTSPGHPLPLPTALRIASEIAAGLEAAHARGIVHRDLKPSNVKVTPEGRTKILDFGIAKARVAPQAGVDPAAKQRAHGTTVAGTLLGTAGYMSPEQASGAPADPQSDVWALGCLLYEMLTGRRAFEGRTFVEALAATLHRDPDWSALPPETPASIRALLGRCLQKDPNQRCRDVRDARLEIEQALAEIVPPPPTVVPRRKPVRAMAVLAVASVVLAVLWQMISGADPIDSVAVLPFENTGADPDGAYLSEGITESLIDRLSELSNLRVVPRGVSSVYTGPDLDLGAVGRELGVGALVTGRVREVGDQLVVRAELIEVSTLANLWGAQYDRSVSDILEVQADLVTQIARELRVRLAPDVEQAITRRDPLNAEAYRLYLRSRYHALQESADGIALGLRYAQDAVDADPTYSLAYAALADAYLASGFRGLLPREEAYPRARSAARRAIELDESASQARLEMALVLFFIDWKWPDAIEEARRAVALDPENPDALSMLGLMQCILGEVDEGLSNVERAIELDPFTSDPHGNLVVCYQRAGRFAEALAAADEVLELAPANLSNRFQRPAILQQLGEHAAAITTLRQTLEAVGVDPGASPRMAVAYARAGRTEDARELLARLDLGSADPTDLADAWVALGEYDLAFASLERALRERSDRLPFMILGGGLAPLHDDPRFDDLRQRVHPWL